jgi:hypothetical protein
VKTCPSFTGATRVKTTTRLTDVISELMTCLAMR